MLKSKLYHNRHISLMPPWSQIWNFWSTVNVKSTFWSSLKGETSSAWTWNVQTSVITLSYVNTVSRFVQWFGPCYTPPISSGNIVDNVFLQAALSCVCRSSGCGGDRTGIHSVHRGDGPLPSQPLLVHPVLPNAAQPGPQHHVRDHAGDPHTSHG